MYDERVMAKLQGFGLEKLQAVRQAADPSDPDMPLLDEAIRRLATAGSRERNLAQAAKEESGAQESYRMASSSIPGAIAQARGAQDLGALAAVPLSAPLAPALVDAGVEMFRRRPRALPTSSAAATSSELGPTGGGGPTPVSGALNSLVERAPSPALARVAGALAVGGAGGGMFRNVPGGGFITKTGEIATMPITAPYRAIAGQAPSGKRAVAAGAGAGLGDALLEAGIRRLPQLVAPLPGEKVEPLDVGREILLPTGLGAAVSTLPGLAGALRSRKSTSGVLADDYARNLEVGTYQRPEMQLPSGKAGNEALEQLASQRTQEVGDAATEVAKRRVSAAKELAAQRVAAGEDAGKRRIEQMAVEEEPKFSAAHAASEREWTDVGYGGTYQELLKQNVRGDPRETISDLRDIVGDLASQSKAKPSSKSAAKPLLVDPQGNEISTAKNSEEQMALLKVGRQAEDMISRFEGYLGPGATLRDYKNAIDEASNAAKGNSSFPVAARVMGRIEEVLRARAKKMFPGFEDLSTRHEAFQSNQERQTQLMYGQDSHDVVDFTGAPREARGRAFLKKAGSDMPEVTSVANEFAELSPYARKAVEASRRAHEEAGFDRVIAENEAADRLRNVEAITKTEKDIATNLVKADMETLGKARVAQEAARSPFGTIGKGLVPTAATIAIHPQWAGYAAAAGGMFAGVKLLQPLRSQLAAALPSPGTMQLQAPSFIAFADALANARARLSAEDASKELVEGARAHARTVSDRLGVFRSGQ